MFTWGVKNGRSDPILAPRNSSDPLRKPINNDCFPHETCKANFRCCIPSGNEACTSAPNVSGSFGPLKLSMLHKCSNPSRLPFHQDGCLSTQVHRPRWSGPGATAANIQIYIGQASSWVIRCRSCMRDTIKQQELLKSPLSALQHLDREVWVANISFFKWLENDSCRAEHCGRRQRPNPCLTSGQIEPTRQIKYQGLLEMQAGERGESTGDLMSPWWRRVPKKGLTKDCEDQEE